MYMCIYHTSCPGYISSQFKCYNFFACFSRTGHCDSRVINCRIYMSSGIQVLLRSSFFLTFVNAIFMLFLFLCLLWNRRKNRRKILTLVMLNTVNSEIFARLIFAISAKRHICEIKILPLGHDLPISVKDRVISPFRGGFTFTCKVSPK